MVSTLSATGRLHVLACPVALCPHVEFAVAGVLGVRVDLRWSPQPAAAAAVCAALDFQGPPGTGARLAARLREVPGLHLQVEEDASPGADAERYSWVPALGLHRAQLSAAGEVALPEGVLRGLLGRARGAELTRGLERLLGQPWEEVLEPLRAGGEAVTVTAWRRTG